jgi:hypothetical protein
MATEDDVTVQMLRAPEGSLFFWRNTFTIETARDRAYAASRTDLEFHPISVLDDIPAFIASLEERPIVGIVLDALAVPTSTQSHGYEELLPYVVSRPVE